MSVKTLVRSIFRIVALVALVAPMMPRVACALTTVTGTVTASDASSVTVSGQSYNVDSNTQVVDRGGQRVAMKEIVPGTAVELEIGDDGDLAVLRAALVR